MKRFVVIGILLLVCIGCDQSTKYTAKHFLKGKPTLSYMDDIFRLSYIENKGAFLSLGADMPAKLRYLVLVMLVFIFLVGFLFFVICSKKLNLLTALSSTLIISGGLGNLIDRMVNQGAVIDFMNIGLGSIRTGVFNGADLAIMVGLLLLLAALYDKEKSAKDEICT
jgi:signal peptidase II